MKVRRRQQEQSWRRAKISRAFLRELDATDENFRQLGRELLIGHGLRSHQVTEQPSMESAEERFLTGKARIKRTHRTIRGTSELASGDRVEAFLFEQSAQCRQNAIARGVAPRLPRSVSPLTPPASWN